MTRPLFRELAEAVFGLEYHRAAAHGLGLNSPRAVYRWSNGQNEAPAEVISWLAAWLETKHEHERRLIERARQRRE